MSGMTIEQALKAIQTEVNYHAGSDTHYRAERLHQALTTLRAEIDGLRAERRKWAAEQMRGLVPPEVEMATATNEREAVAFFGSNYCRAETLANIERWEQSHD